MSIFKKKADFYHTFAMLLNAGLPCQNALKQSFGTSLFNRIAARLHQRIEGGSTLFEAASEEKLFTHFELTMILVGEYSGRLPTTLKALSDWFYAKHELRSKITNSLLYPLFLYHVAGAVFTIVSIFTKTHTPAVAALQLLLWIAVPWLALLICKLIMPAMMRNTAINCIIDILPLLGDLQFKLNTSFFFKVLGISLSSGSTASKAITLAADCCHSPLYAEHYKKMAYAIERDGCSICSAYNQFATRRELTSSIPAIMASAETAGNLPEACEKIADMQMNESAAKIEFLTKAIPNVLYAIICIVVGYKIISFYAGYFRQINELL